MGLLEELLEMSSGWPTWQSDALRRIFATGAIAEQDLVDIRAVLEEAEGAPISVPLKVAHIPTMGDGQTTVLQELRDLQHVNRFAPGSRIQFNPEGLNIVFGTNGAGKSGYTRVLKRACRARRSAEVLPDAFAESSGTPSAGIVVLDAQGNSILYDWQEGMHSDSRLAMVAVYDSHCGEDYIAQEGSCEYQPYGIPQLGELTQGMMRLQASIRHEREAIRLDVSPFAALKGAHSVGKAIDSLSADTDLDHIRQLGEFNQEHETRIVEIDQLLTNLDLEPQAKAKDGLATRLEQAASKCRSIESVSSDRAVDRLQELHASVLAAVDADRLAQGLLQGEDGDELAGTGSDAWKTLFRAAEAFSAQVYLHDEQHPSTDEGAHCVLCQQPLAQSARERLERFRTYVASEAATALNTANTALSNAVQMVADGSTDVIDEATLADLRELDATTADLIAVHQKAWSARRQWAAQANATENWCCPRTSPAPQPALSAVLAEKAKACRARAVELRAANDEARIRSLSDERTFLAAKRGLAAVLPLAEQYVQDARKARRLKSLEDQLQTKALSARITKMSQQYITEELLQAMKAELAWLGARSQKPAMKSRTAYGVSMITLTLESANSPPSTVLSEGEQRAMGLALFLAEAQLRGDKSTLVFDDPSTSLDHRFRKKMARRLVELAKERQVVVFTHDAVFLTELRMAANGQGLEPTLQSIEWADHRPGSVVQGLAWENEKFFPQIDRIRKDAVDLEEVCNDHLNDVERLQMRNLYAMLRGALERGIREVVLHDVVHPFADQVKIENVGAVIGFTLEDWKAIVELHDDCSGVISAHDTPSDNQQEIPHPSELLERLKAIRSVFEGCKARNSEFERTILTPHRTKRNALRKG
ncbi:AAA family ATPase [Stenotrophomonas riyadhensis]